MMLILLKLVQRFAVTQMWTSNNEIIKDLKWKINGSCIKRNENIALKSVTTS